MKKIFAICLLSLFTIGAFAQATAPRFGTTKNKDNTGRVLTYGYIAPVYAATIAITPNYFDLVVKPETLTGALTINLDVTSARVGDRIECLFLSDGTGRVVTFGTGFASSGTLTLILSKRGSASFVFDGVAYVETGRAIQP